MQVTFQDKPIPVMLLANKCDLEGEELSQKIKGLDAFAKDGGFVSYPLPRRVIETKLYILVRFPG